MQSSGTKKRASEPPQPLQERRRELAGALFGEGVRGRILMACADLLASEGHAGFPVKRVLDGADVSRRTFYKHFGGLDEVLDALYLQAVQLVRGTLSLAMAAEPDPKRKLWRVLDAYLDIQQAGGALVVALHDEAMSPRSSLAPRREALLDELVAGVTHVARVNSGTQIDPLAIRGFLLGIEGLIRHLQRTDSLNDSSRERIGLLANRALRGLLVDAA